MMRADIVLGPSATWRPAPVAPLAHPKQTSMASKFPRFTLIVEPPFHSPEWLSWIERIACHERAWGSRTSLGPEPYPFAALDRSPIKESEYDEPRRQDGRGGGGDRGGRSRDREGVGFCRCTRYRRGPRGRGAARARTGRCGDDARRCDGSGAGGTDR